VISGANIKNLTGLSSLTSIGGELVIHYNDALTSLTGLSSLTSIGGYLRIYYNDALTSLTGLSSLTSIEGYLDISYNNALTSLTGLDNVDLTNSHFIYLDHSNLLSLCAVKSICDFLANPSNYADIYENAAGCSTNEEVVAACLALPTANLENPKVNVFPNPTTGIIEIQGINSRPLNRV